MKLLIAGDLSLQDRAKIFVTNEDNLDLAFGRIKELNKDVDYSIVNLESPITNNDNGIIKDGPILNNPQSIFNVIHYCNFSIVTLANNHLKDYGSKGVVDTIKNCQAHNIQFVGAGNNLDDARSPLILNNNEIIVGLLNVCENESSIAGQKSAGAAPLSEVNLYYDIKKLKESVDKVLVIVHGGREHYQLPTPRMKQLYHFLIDIGADIVVNHHQHCYSGYELYNGKPIFYGLGNFYFDNPRKRNEKWNYGLLLELDIQKEQTYFKLTPFEQCNDEATIKLRNYESVKDEIEKLNSIIADDCLLKDAFEKMVNSTKPLYPFLPYGNHYLRALYARGYLPDGISLMNKAKIENAIRCETHREVLLYYLNMHLHND